jgi:beta-lactamase regulating signal transducer with metallopeptidase domain
VTTLIATLLSNAVTVTVLAFFVFAVSRKIQSQRFAHGLWVILLLKLITPSLFALPLTFHVDDSWLTIDSRFFFGDSTADRQSMVESRSAEAGLIGNGTQVDPAAVAHGDGDPSNSEFASAGADTSLATKRGWVERWPRVIVLLLLLTWLAGSCLYVARLLIRYFRFCRFLRNNELIDEELISEGYDLAYKMGLKRPPRVRVLSGAFSPMLCGLGRGVTLILPLDLLHRLTPEGRATLVVHELSHYARGDYLVRVLETIVMAVFWWHPVVWWIRRELEIVEEDCCDSRVLAEFPGQPRHYAEAILDAIDFLSERPMEMPPIASGLGTTPLLKRRLTRIMTETSVEESPRWGTRPVIACVVVLVPLQMVQFRSEPVPVAQQTIDATADLADVTVQHPQLSVEEIAAIASSRVWSTVKSPDGRWSVLVDHEQQCRLFSSIERRCAELPTSMVSTVVFSPDSQRLAIGTTDGRLLILRNPDWTVEFNLGRGSAIRSVDWSPNGDRIALCTEAGDLKLLSSDDGSAISLRRLPMTCLNCVRFSADANHVIVGCGDWKTEVDSALLILDAGSLNLANVWNSEAPIAFVRLGDQSDEITVCDWSGRINLLSLTDLRLLNSQWIPKDLVPPLAFSIQSDDAGVITGAF